MFPTPKTFALATCTSHEADENCRNKLRAETQLPPAKSERTSHDANGQDREDDNHIGLTPVYWKATNSGIRNDIASITQGWGWNSVQQYAPEDYNSKVKYLEQPCNHVAKLIENATKEDETRRSSNSHLGFDDGYH